jgi:formamidopyrimidine-DNA glycosylase
MPELPEVETVRRGLQPVMEGRAIARAEVRREGLRRPFPARMGERLEGGRVERLRRRAKYLLADLSSGETLIIHLGMSGRMLIGGDAPGAFRHPRGVHARHDHVVFHLEGGTRIAFNDARRFGVMDLAPTAELEEHPLLRELGPEPLGNAFSESHLVAALRARRAPVKTALLDQRVVAGLGNIYVCEALHRAGISPRRQGAQTAPARLAGLVPVIREVLNEAIAAGGSSLRDHRQVSGELGYFQHAFRVYGREGEPCLTPGCGGTIRRFTQAGRSTFWCPRCQR